MYKRDLDEKDENGMGFAKLVGVVRMVKFKCFWFSFSWSGEKLGIDKFLNELAKALFVESWMLNSNNSMGKIELVIKIKSQRSQNNWIKKAFLGFFIVLAS